MGMFDYVDASALDIPFKVHHQYQTKDFDNLMNTLIFNKDGTITREYHLTEMVPEEERPYYGKPEWEKSKIYQFIGSMRNRELIVEQVGIPERETYHFYGNVDDDSSDKKTWLDIYADAENHKIVQLRWEIRNTVDWNNPPDRTGIILLTNDTE
jgi:hypothetical protein